MSVLLGVAHGSRDEGAQEVVRDLLVRTAALHPGLRAEAAYIDNATPSVQNAVAHLVAEGERDITVIPLLLGAASHSKSDLAGSVQAARWAHPDVTFRYGRPLGPHPVLVDVLARRLDEAGAGELPVVVVANGSRDPDANAGVAATARLLFEGRLYPSVDYAFVSATRPTVGEALSRLRAQGHPRVAIARYFLGPGYLPSQVEVQALEVDVDAVIAAPLGVSDELAALLLERYVEARAGDVRMNCDACLYRIAFPGRAAQVGEPQRPHAHPDDEF